MKNSRSKTDNEKLSSEESDYYNNKVIDSSADSDFQETFLFSVMDNEKLFRAFLTASMDMVYSMSSDWKEMHHLLGRDFVPDTNKPNSNWLNKYILPEDHPYVLEKINEAIKGKNMFDLEHRILRIDGTIGWIRSRAVPLLDEKGEIVEWIGAASDITDQKHAEEILKEAERKYRELVQFSPAAIYEIDFKKRRFTSVNEAMCIITNYTREELLQIDPFDMVDEEDRILFQSQIDQWLRDEEPDTQPEYKIKTKDGRVINVLLNVTFKRDPDGKPLGATVVANDITERKRTEEALRESEERLKFAQDSAGAGIWDWDMPSGKLNWSEALFKIFDLKPSKEGASFESWRSVLHPEDRQKAEENIEKAIKNKTKIESEYRIKLKNGKVRWIRTLGNTMYDDNAEPLRMSGICIDITGRKQIEKTMRESESKYRTLFDSIDEAFCILELIYNESGKAIDCRYMEVNKVFAQHTGITENVVGKLASEVAPNLEEYWYKLYDRVLHTGEPMRLENYNEATGRWYQTHAARIGGEGSHLVGIVFDDITERKRIEQELKKMNETLMEQVLERTEIANIRANQSRKLAVALLEAEEKERQRIADLLHEDIQQILAVAKLQLQIACKELPPVPELAEVEKLLDESMKKTRHLSHELSPEVLYHSGLIPALKWLAGQMKSQLGLEVLLKVNQEKKLESISLRIFIFRVVQELLFNVTKHASVHRVTVALTFRQNILKVTVSDKGVGFNPNILDNPTDKTGFGLMSLRERVQDLGGSIDITSTLGKGTKVTLTFPLNLRNTTEEKKLHSHKRHGVSVKPAIQKANGFTRVLLADDHTVIRQALTRMLKDQPDIEIVGEASNGNEAVELALDLRPDIILMDVAMPEMDGIEATRHIKEALPDVRVIGLSVYENEQIKEAMQNAGAERYLLKSESSSQLLRAIYRMKKK